MVKITGPLHSDSASGSVCDVLTFSQRASGQQCRYQKKQKDVITPDRTAQRIKFNLGLDLWRALPDNEKYYWTEIEKSGFIII
jgi:hypothetical protein